MLAPLYTCPLIVVIAAFKPLKQVYLSARPVQEAARNPKPGDIDCKNVLYVAHDW